MLYEDKNYYLLTKEEFNDEINKNKDKVKLYHFIVYKYQNGTAIILDDFNNLSKVPDNYKVKYYCEQIKYIDENDNEYFEYGGAYHIVNIGYFRIGGFAHENSVPNSSIEKLFIKYDKEFPNMKFDVGDNGFLMLGS